MVLPSKFSYKSYTKPKNPPTEQTENFKCQYQVHNVCKKMQIFFQEQNFCDVVLIAGIDGVRIGTHRMILAASSDYFFAMFGGCLSESRAKEVILDQVDGVTLKTLVNFMYTALIEIRNDNVENLLTAASLFQMDSVAEQCCNFIIKQLDASNCLAITLYAEQHNHRNLYKNAYDMVCNHFTELHNEDEFYSLDVHQLSKFLSSDDLCVTSEEDVFQSIIKWVNHDKENRQKFLYKLLGNLRFPLLNRGYIENEVAAVCQFIECQELITRELEGHTESLHARPRNPKRKIFYISVWFTGDSILSTEVFSPILKKWIYKEWGGKPNNRSVFSGTVLGDKLIIAGGRSEYFTPTNIVESLCLKTFKWTELPPMNERRYSFGMAELNGKVYAIGGRDDNGGLRSVERYDPATQVWENLAPMWEKRCDHSAVAMNGLLYVIGGSYSFECYDPQTNIWIRKATMKSSTSPSGMAVVNDKLYAVSTKGNIVQRYDSVNNSWEEVSRLGLNTETIQCCSMGDSLIVNCGNYVVKEFNTKTYEWTTLPPFGTLSGKGLLLSM